MAEMPPMNGLYNIQAEQDCGYTVYQTVRRLPPPREFDDESAGIASQVRRVVESFLKKGGYPQFNEIMEEVFGQDSIGEFPSDRTMCFFVGDLDVFTPSLFGSSRKRFSRNSHCGDFVPSLRKSR